MMIVVNAAKVIREKTIDGQPIDIKIPQNGEYNSYSSIFISNLHESVTESDLIKEFSRFGLILACMVMQSSLINNRL